MTDPTPTNAHLGHGAAVVDSALLVFREGLEAILVLAAFTASMRARPRLRARLRPAPARARRAVGTWFARDRPGRRARRPAGLDVQAATGMLAVVVLLVIMNWFFHKIYWTGWITPHNRRRRDLIENGERRTARLFGLALIGFTSVYREGFEIVLFLQNTRLIGKPCRLLGLAIGLDAHAPVAYLTFALHCKLPYKRMLVITGVMLGCVLVVMVGESIQEMQLAGWLPVHSLGVAFPGWLGLWFALFPTVEGVVAQVLAGGIVLGSYFLAEHVRRHAAGAARGGRARSRRATSARRASAEAVDAREAVGEEADEQRGRQADDVQVVALDPLDEARAEPLDRIGARPSLPLPGCSGSARGRAA